MVKTFQSIIKNSFRKVGVELSRWKPPYHGVSSLVKNSECDIELILDIGANKGQSADRFLNLFPEAELISFEPLPNLRRELEEKYKGNSSVKIIEKAVSDASGTSMFQVNTESDLSSLLSPETGACNQKTYHYGGEVIDSVEVVLTTVDLFMDEQGIEQVSLLKLDVEGNEFQCLKGAKQSLQSHSIDIVHMEVSFVSRYEGEVCFLEVYRFLDELNYSLYDLREHKRADDGQLRMANAIFIDPKTKISLQSN